MLARHLHEAAHVRPRLPAEQRLASGRRTVMDEVVERGVVGQERHRLVDEVQNGDADRLSHRSLIIPDLPAQDVTPLLVVPAWSSRWNTTAAEAGAQASTKPPAGRGRSA